MTTEISQILISDAFADEEVKHNDSHGASTLKSFAPLILITIVFYFLVIRPQQKKNKEHQEKLKSLSRGDEIMTTGGIMATISNVPHDSDYITIEIAPDVKVKLNKSYVVDLVQKEKQKGKSEKQEKKSSKKQEEKTSEKDKN